MSEHDVTATMNPATLIFVVCNSVTADLPDSHLRRLVAPARCSMITVHKYMLLPPADVVEIHTHEGAELLTVGVQVGAPVLWARVDTDEPEQVRRLRVAGTGHKDAYGEYVGTFMYDDGEFVFHVFDLGPKS